MKALVDTGSQVTTLPLSFVKGQLSERTLERPHHFLKLTAANGGIFLWLGCWQTWMLLSTGRL